MHGITKNNYNSDEKQRYFWLGFFLFQIPSLPYLSEDYHEFISFTIIIFGIHSKQPSIHKIFWSDQQIF